MTDWDETPNPVETRYGLDTNDDDDDDIIAIFRDVNKQLPTQEEKEGVDDDDTNNNWDHEGAAWGRVLDQLKNWRQLSTNQRATIEKLQLITAHQHKMLVDHGIVVSDPSDNRYNENSSNYNINFMYYHHQLQQQLPHDLVGV